MEIIEKKIEDITPYEKNPRKNDEAELVIEMVSSYNFNEDVAIVNNKYVVTKNGEVYTVNLNKKGIKRQNNPKRRHEQRRIHGVSKGSISKYD